MCNPAAALAAGQTAVSVMGTMQQGRAAAAAQRYDADIADENARRAGETANDALRRGETAAFDHYREVRSLMGTQEAQAAANGLDPTSGSAGYVISDSALLGHIDASRIRENARREALGYDYQASGYRADATGKRRAARNTQIATRYAVAGTLLSGASQTYSAATKTR